MLIRHQISLFIITFLAVGFFILALPEKGLGGEEVCCLISPGNCEEFDRETCALGKWTILEIACAEVPACAPPSCSIEIVKVADPADDTEFNFSATVENPQPIDSFDFTLKDPSDATKIIIIKVGEVLIVTEEVSIGWILNEDKTHVECTGKAEFINIFGVPNGLEFECDDVDTVTCTFFNDIVATEVPTLSEWGLIVMAGILGIVGFMVLRRRKAAV